MKTFLTYIKQSFAELKNVKWPNRQTTIQYSVIVLASLVIVTVFFGLVDYGLQEALNYFFLRS